MEHPVSDLLIHIWMGILTFMLYMYVALDGFDLGVGILSILERDRRRQIIMMDSLNGVWDANETWLVLLGGTLFGAFPLVYGNALQVLYIPVILMLLALVFRGVSLEFRIYSERPGIWIAAFGFGSLVATGAQGVALGTLLAGIPLFDDHSAVDIFVWRTPLAWLAALVLVDLYVLLGSCYLAGKVENSLQTEVRHWAGLAAIMLPFLVLLLLATASRNHPYLSEQWQAKPLIFGGLGLATGVAYVLMLLNLRRKREHAPFIYLLVALAGGMVFLQASYYPYVIPGVMTLHAAASSQITLEFMLYAVGTLVPLMLVYNAYQYYVFRGRITSEH